MSKMTATSHDAAFVNGPAFGVNESYVQQIIGQNQNLSAKKKVTTSLRNWKDKNA